MSKDIKNIETKESSLETVSCKITAQLKSDTEKILNRLGLGYSEAIKIYFNQIVLTNSIPFNLTIPSSYVKSKEKKVTRNVSKKKTISKKPLGTKTNQESYDVKLENL